MSNIRVVCQFLCYEWYVYTISHKVELFHFRGSHGSDGMVLDLHLPVESVPLTTKFVSSNPVHVNVYSIQQHYVIKFVSDFLQVLRFPPPIKRTTTI